MSGEKEKYNYNGEEMDSFVPCEKSQEDPCYPVEFEKTLWEIERDWMGTGELSKTIQEMLKRATAFYQADRAHIIEVDWDLYIGNATYEYCAEGIPSKMQALQDIDISKFPRWRVAAEEKTPIYLKDLESIRETEPAEYDFLKEQGAHSLLGIPLHRNLPGYFVISNAKKYGSYTNLIRSLSYAIAAETTVIGLEQTIPLKGSSYPVLGVSEIMLTFFGGLEVTTPIGAMKEQDIKSPKVVELIAFLYFRRKRNVTTHEIADALWDGQELRDPAKQVRDTVYRAKKTFKNICTESIIVRNGDYYALNSNSQFKTDLDKFENLSKQVKTMSDLSEKLRCYKHIFELYKGVLLPSINSAHWLLSSASAYQWDFHTAILDCLKMMYQHDMFYEVRELSTHALSFDHSDGAVQNYLIHAMAKMGSRDAAVQQYQSAADTLTEEQTKEIKKLLAAS